MSKPFAAKGFGACFLKRVLNTRLLPAALVEVSRALRARRTEPRPGTPCQTARRMGTAVRLIPGLRKFSARPALADGDPLPPEDRVSGSGALTLEDLYRREAPRLLRFFGRHLERHDASDLVQESFVRFADASAAGETPIRQPEAYLNTVALNLVRNRAKIALRRSLALHVDLDDESASAPDPVAALEARDLLNRVQVALMRLSPKTRAIFLAHRVDGRSYKEIANQTGLSIKGVEWHMTKAISHLDRALNSR